MEEIKWHDQVDAGKLDLVVNFNLRMDSSANYADIVLPTAHWYEKHDLTCSDLHSFLHPFNPAHDPPWECKTDWEGFKVLAKKFSELAADEFEGPVKEVVMTALQTDTPDEMAQPLGRVHDWRAGECEPVPGKTFPNVKVKFYNLPSMVAEDSTTSLSTGAYSINISPGYYLVEWTKTGYVPWELGGLVLTANTVLDDVDMIPGSVSEVSGTINTTTWTTSYVYYVTDDITIPSGQTLTINAGVRVKFSSGKGMTVNGTLIANGTASSRIIFTSRESVPAPGDWNRIYMHGTNNQLSYFDYLYAANSLRTDGSNAATNTTIDNGYLANLGSEAHGLYLYNGGGESVTNNSITVSSASDKWGIYNNSSESTTITNNTITAANGIYIHDVDGGENVTGNTIVAANTGIQADYAHDVTIKDNTITGVISNKIGRASCRERV